MIDRVFCRVLSADVEAALKVVAEKHGMDLVIEGGSFDSTQYRPKVSFKAKTAEGRPAEWDRWCKVYGFNPEDHGKIFRSHTGDEYCIDGIDPGKPKYPVLATRVKDGKKFKFTNFEVKTGLGRLSA